MAQNHDNSLQQHDKHPVGQPIYHPAHPIIEDHHNHSVYEELLCHLPYAIFSVAFGLIVLSCLQFVTSGMSGQVSIPHKAAKALFHSFHFLHLIFAATGTVLMFLRFSTNKFLALIVGTLAPAVFCLLSDVVLPYLGGRLLGVPMHLHICFISEYQNVLPFLIIGIINGFAMSKHAPSNLAFYSIGSHFIHILVSSMASLLYLVSHGFVHWQSQMGIIFLFLLIAVLVPCTLSDVVVPMLFARSKGARGNEKHPA